MKDSNKPFKRRKRRRYATVDADRGIELGARCSLHGRDRTTVQPAAQVGSQDYTGEREEHLRQLFDN